MGGSLNYTSRQHDAAFAGSDALICTICREREVSTDAPEWQWDLAVCADEQCINQRCGQLTEAERKLDYVLHKVRGFLEDAQDALQIGRRVIG